MIWLERLRKSGGNKLASASFEEKISFPTLKFVVYFV